MKKHEKIAQIKNETEIAKKRAKWVKTREKTRLHSAKLKIRKFFKKRG